MTISSTVRVAGPFIGNGTASTFPFTFKVFAAADLDVIRLASSTGVESTLVLNSDYSVALNGDQNTNPGGSITLLAGALASGFTLTITSDIANLQPTDLTNQGGFYPEVITDSFDRATIQIQQLADEQVRSLRAPVSDALPLNMDLPVISERAGKFLTFDGAGEPTVSSGTGTDTALRTDLANQTAVSAGAGLVGFRQLDATATGRTVLSKLREGASVIDFGAVADGVTDDTAAFNAAWTARTPNPVLVPPASYAITGTVTGEFYTFGTVTIVGGTVNTVNRFTGAMQLDGSTFVVDATNNRVGINTASPTHTLSVTGNATVSGSATFGGTLAVTGNTTLTGDLAVNGADITTTATGTATVFNATATAVNIGGAATTMAVGSQSAGTVSMNNLSMNAGYGSIAPVFGCRAWVNFNGTGTVAIRASGNVSSITDNGNGDYTVNFTTAMPDDNYCVCTSCTAAHTSVNYVAGVATATASNVRILAEASNGNESDLAWMNVAIFR